MTSSDAAMAQPVGMRATLNGQTGIWLLLAEIVMLFVAFTSAMVVRRGAADDWVPVVLPASFQMCTLLLLAGSVLVELARKRARGTGDVLEVIMRQNVSLWLTATILCGLGFLCCQWLGFRALAARGVSVVSGPASAFVYVFCVAHSIHLLGGVIGLVYVVLSAMRSKSANAKWFRNVVTSAAIYWYSMTVLWVYILAIFAVWL